MVRLSHNTFSCIPITILDPLIDLVYHQVPSWCCYSVSPPSPPACGRPRLQALRVPRFQNRPRGGGWFWISLRRRRIHYGIFGRFFRLYYSAVLPRLIWQLKSRDFALRQFVGRHVTAFLSGDSSEHDTQRLCTILTQPYDSYTF